MAFVTFSLLSAVFVFLAVWIVQLHECALSFITFFRHRVVCKGATNIAAGSVTSAMLIRLLAACLQQGSSIPQALQAVAPWAGSTRSQVLWQVSDSLLAGYSWDESWSGTIYNDAVLELLETTLREAWYEGIATARILDTMVETAQEYARIEIEHRASTLSVQILAPMGFCLLPAFVIVAVLPILVSFISYQ